MLLVASILILEWHYFADMLGGIAIAAVVIWIVGNMAEERPPATAHVNNKLTM